MAAELSKHIMTSTANRLNVEFVFFCIALVVVILDGLISAAYTSESLYAWEFSTPYRKCDRCSSLELLGIASAHHLLVLGLSMRATLLIKTPVISLLAFMIFSPPFATHFALAGIAPISFTTICILAFFTPAMQAAAPAFVFRKIGQRLEDFTAFTLSGFHKKYLLPSRVGVKEEGEWIVSRHLPTQMFELGRL